MDGRGFFIHAFLTLLHESNHTIKAVTSHHYSKKSTYSHLSLGNNQGLFQEDFSYSSATTANQHNFLGIMKLYLLPICSQWPIKVYRKLFYSNFRHSSNSALFYTREILSSSPLSLPLQTPIPSPGGGDTCLHLANKALYKSPTCTASVF